MQYKKKIFYFILVLIGLFSLTNLNLFALPELGEKMDEIPDFSAEETCFGKMTEISSVDTNEAKTYYKSHWTSQPALTKDYIIRTDKIFEFDYYFDIPVHLLFEQRFKPGYGLKETQKINKSFKKTIKEIDEINRKFYVEFTKNKKIELKVPLDITELKAKKDNGFKIGVEWLEKHITEVTEETSVNFEATREYPPYVNNHNYPVFLCENFRQRNKVYLMCSYAYEYKVERFGTGLFGIDDNFTYKFEKYVCESLDVFLIPEGEPYFEISEYEDAGEKIYINQELPNVVFA